MWVGVEAETVGWLPEGIDDLKVYDIKNYCNSDALRDGRARKLDTNSIAKFMTLCDNLLFSATEAAYYESTKAEINEFYCSKVRVGIFVICAFASRDALRMNQAEFIHAGWVYRDRPNLSIV